MVGMYAGATNRGRGRWAVQVPLEATMHAKSVPDLGGTEEVVDEAGLSHRVLPNKKDEGLGVCSCARVRVGQ